MNNITAKDLMIGDWVLYNPNVFIEDEYELTKDTYPTKISCGEDIDLAFEDCYSTIPITPEILEKNGFQQISTNKYISSKVTIAVFAEEFLITVKSENVRGMFTLKYVHQLQHALRLAGIDKKIKL